MTESTDTMADAPTGGHSALGILELADVCATMRARCTDAFEQLGRWVTSEAAGAADGRVRRGLAAAAHRHARHADLWLARTPTIPIAVAVPPVDTTLAAVEGATPDDVVAAYAAWRAAMVRDLDALAARVDPELDPGTAEVIEQIRFDVRRSEPVLERPARA